MKGSIFIILAVILISMTAFSTPNNAVWENEILLGKNDNYFYTIKKCKYLTGTYYQNIDSLFLLEKEIDTGKITEKIILRVVDNIADPMTMNWTKTEKMEKPINVIKYQTDKKIEFVYPSRFSGSRFKFYNNGLFLNYNGSEELILDKNYLDRYIDWFEKSIMYQEKYQQNYDFQVRISESYESFTHIYLIVETGSDHTDSDFRQSILVFPKDKYELARKRIVSKNK